MLQKGMSSSEAWPPKLPAAETPLDRATLQGLGPKKVARLAAIGIRTVDQLARVDEAEAAAERLREREPRARDRHGRAARDRPRRGPIRPKLEDKTTPRLL